MFSLLDGLVNYYRKTLLLLFSIIFFKQFYIFLLNIASKYNFPHQIQIIMSSSCTLFEPKQFFLQSLKMEYLKKLEAICQNKSSDEKIYLSFDIIKLSDNFLKFCKTIVPSPIHSNCILEFCHIIEDFIFVEQKYLSNQKIQNKYLSKLNYSEIILLQIYIRLVLIQKQYEQMKYLFKTKEDCYNQQFTSEIIYFFKVLKKDLGNFFSMTVKNLFEIIMKNNNTEQFTVYIQELMKNIKFQPNLQCFPSISNVLDSLVERSFTEKSQKQQCQNSNRLDKLFSKDNQESTQDTFKESTNSQSQTFKNSQETKKLEYTSKPPLGKFQEVLKKKKMQTSTVPKRTLYSTHPYQNQQNHYIKKEDFLIDLRNVSKETEEFKNRSYLGEEWKVKESWQKIIQRDESLIQEQRSAIQESNLSLFNEVLK